MKKKLSCCTKKGKVKRFTSFSISDILGWEKPLPGSLLNLCHISHKGDTNSTNVVSPSRKTLSKNLQAGATRRTYTAKKHRNRRSSVHDKKSAMAIPADFDDEPLNLSQSNTISPMHCHSSVVLLEPTASDIQWTDDGRPEDSCSNHKVDDRGIKKHRTTFTSNQTEELERCFKHKNYLTTTERNDLAMLLQISEMQIKIWFQNRRTKQKKHLHRPSSQSSQSDDEGFTCTEFNI